MSIVEVGLMGAANVTGIWAMWNVQSAKSIVTDLLRSMAWLAAGAGLIGAGIVADLVFDLALLEGGMRRDGSKTHALVVVAASALTLLGLLLCVLAAWRAIASLVLGVLGGR